jgi:hypothetical protein
MWRHVLRFTAGVFLAVAVVAHARARLGSQCQTFFWVDPDGVGHETENCTVPGEPSYGWGVYTWAPPGEIVTQCYDYRSPYCEDANDPAAPPPDSCGDERDKLIAEYQSNGVGWRPFCSSFTQSTPTQSQYDFGSPRQVGTWCVDDDYHWAVLKDSVTANLYCVVANYGSTPAMTSGYRSPIRNAAVNGATNSRHLYGDAADLQTPPAPDDNVYNALKAIAKSGNCGVACVEPRNISGSHFHADYRPGGCPSGW